MATVLLVLVFWALFVAVLRRPGAGERLRARGPVDWFVDLAGLAVQGAAIPALSALLAAVVWPPLLPGGVLRVGPVGAFLLQFVLVDYLYYWNHRLLHQLWPLHRLHHTAPAMDVLVTSRNTLWTSLFIVYLWANSLLTHLVDAPEGVAWGMVLTAALDMWRHSGLPGRLPGLVSPTHHAWHHSAERHDVNFGANWTWWDRLHGTFLDRATPPAHLGVAPDPRPSRAVWWPFPGDRGSP